MIGATSRAAGHTELVCRLIRHFCRRHDLVGVSVTIVAGRDGGESPWGGEDDGVCGSLEGGFDLVDVGSFPPGEDATRLHEAGASRVLRLRVRSAALTPGFDALRRALGPGELAVCASTALRAVADPDLFLLLGRDDPGALGAGGIEEPAAAVADFADRVVRFDGRGFDLDPGALDIVAGRWRLRESATGIVLAGGRSGRMGRDKRVLPIEGRDLLEHVVAQLRPHVGEILIGANDPAQGDALGLRTVADRVPGEGPLMGLASCLRASASDRNLVAACDLPDIPAALVTRMLDKALVHDAVVPLGAGGYIEPLLAVYRRRLLPDAERLLAAGVRQVRPLYEYRDVEYLDLDALGLAEIPNLNTWQDYETYLRRRGSPG